MAAVTVLLAVWLLAGVWGLKEARLPSAQMALCVGALILGLALRLVGFDHITYDYRDFLSWWAAFFRSNGGFAALKEPVGNYNLPYLYFLAAISYLPVYDLYLIKLFSIFFDLLLAFAGMKLAKKVFTSPGAGAGAFTLLLVLPTVILNGSVWGQCDSIYGALVVLALADALDDHPARSVVWLGLAFAFKLQTVFLMPLWCVLWFTGRVRFRHLLLFPAVNVLLSVPAVCLGKPVGDIVGVYIGQTVEYRQYLTLNAPSVYALIPYGMEVDTEFWARIGVIAAFSLVFLVLAWCFYRRRTLTNDDLLTTAVILAIGVPLLLPHMHDRYFFLADTLTVVWAMGNRKRFPIPTAVQIASLGGYHAYLLLRYAFPMAWGAWLLICALVGLLIHFIWSTVKNKPPGSPEKAEFDLTGL